MPKTESFDREQVLEKAMGVFRKKGYHGSSMQDLVDEMGINRSSVYNSFGDKHHLFKETLQLYQSRQRSWTHNWLLKAENARHAIELLFAGIQEDILADKQNLGCFIAKSASEFDRTDVDFYSIITKNQQDMEAMFADLIKKGQEEGNINSQLDPTTTASYLFSSLQGVRMTGMLRPNKAYVSPIIEQILSIL